MKKEYIGKWRIEEMELWDRDFIDLTAPGQIIVEGSGIGSIRFGAFKGGLDCRVEKIGENERLEFSFEGSDEGDQVSGRGWAFVEEEKMTGRIYFHLGDDSGFKAKKIK